MSARMASSDSSVSDSDSLLLVIVLSVDFSVVSSVSGANCNGWRSSCEAISFAVKLSSSTISSCWILLLRLLFSLLFSKIFSVGAISVSTEFPLEISVYSVMFSVVISTAFGVKVGFKFCMSDSDSFVPCVFCVGFSVTLITDLPARIWSA